MVQMLRSAVWKRLSDSTNWQCPSAAGGRLAVGGGVLRREKMPSKPGEFHPESLTGRVEDWRAGLGVVELIAKSDVENTRQSCLSRFVRYQVRA
jgi:hypothetical protein